MYALSLSPRQCTCRSQTHSLVTMQPRLAVRVARLPPSSPPCCVSLWLPTSSHRCTFTSCADFIRIFFLVYLHVCRYCRRCLGATEAELDKCRGREHAPAAIAFVASQVTVNSASVFHCYVRYIAAALALLKDLDAMLCLPRV